MSNLDYFLLKTRCENSIIALNGLKKECYTEMLSDAYMITIDSLQLYKEILEKEIKGQPELEKSRLIQERMSEKDKTKEILKRIIEKEKVSEKEIDYSVEFFNNLKDRCKGTYHSSFIA